MHKAELSTTTALALVCVCVHSLLCFVNQKDSESSLVFCLSSQSLTTQGWGGLVGSFLKHGRRTARLCLKEASESL